MDVGRLTSTRCIIETNLKMSLWWYRPVRCCWWGELTCRAAPRLTWAPAGQARRCSLPLLLPLVFSLSWQSQRHWEQLSLSQYDVSKGTGWRETGRAGQGGLSHHDCQLVKHLWSLRHRRPEETPHHKCVRVACTTHCSVSNGNVSSNRTLALALMSPADTPIGRAGLHYTQFPQSLALVLSNCRLIAW